MTTRSTTRPPWKEVGCHRICGIIYSAHYVLVVGQSAWKSVIIVSLFHHGLVAPRGIIVPSYKYCLYLSRAATVLTRSYPDSVLDRIR